MRTIKKIKKFVERKFRLTVRGDGWTAMDREICRQFLSFLKGKRDMVFLPKEERTKALFIPNGRYYREGES